MDILHSGAQDRATLAGPVHGRGPRGPDRRPGVIVMIPFCRSVREAERVLELMAENGLKRGEELLQAYDMCEIPSNVILARASAERFDGVSIGSNDPTRLTLGGADTILPRPARGAGGAAKRQDRDAVPQSRRQRRHLGGGSASPTVQRRRPARRFSRRQREPLRLSPSG